jgi:hypothetical protein
MEMLNDRQAGALTDAVALAEAAKVLLEHETPLFLNVPSAARWESVRKLARAILVQRIPEPAPAKESTEDVVERRLVKLTIAGLELTRGDDGYWLSFDGGTKKGAIHLENTFKYNILHETIMLWAQSQTEIGEPKLKIAGHGEDVCKCLSQIEIAMLEYTQERFPEWTEEERRNFFLWMRVRLNQSIDPAASETCDYRRDDCCVTGVQLGGRWICINHLPEVKGRDARIGDLEAALAAVTIERDALKAELQRFKAPFSDEEVEAMAKKISCDPWEAQQYGNALIAARAAREPR